MSNNYLWNRSGAPDPDTEQLEELLSPLAHVAPLDELRLAKGRRSELERATAQEPVEAPRTSGRVKGKMNFFDKRIIGTATVTAAICLFGVTLYERRDSSRHVWRRSPRNPYRQPNVDIDSSARMDSHLVGRTEDRRGSRDHGGRERVGPRSIRRGRRRDPDKVQRRSRDDRGDAGSNGRTRIAPRRPTDESAGLRLCARSRAIRRRYSRSSLREWCHRPDHRWHRERGQASDDLSPRA